MREFFGPGWQMYYIEQGDQLIVMLGAWLEPPAPSTTSTAGHTTMQQTLSQLTQQRLRTISEPVPPVTSTLETRSVLVHSIDITKHPDWIRLLFKDHTGHPIAPLTLEPVPLRSWLNILFDQYTAADWSCETWPEWMTGQGAEVGVPVGERAVWH